MKIIVTGKSTEPPKYKPITLNVSYEKIPKPEPIHIPVVYHETHRSEPISLKITYPSDQNEGGESGVL